MKIIAFFFISFFVGLALPLFFYSRIFAANDKPLELISPVPASQIAEAESISPDSQASFDKPLSNKPVSILLLGVDGRKGDKNPRCDAIHTVKYDPLERKITIYSVPRGTPVALASAPEGSAYISNACHYTGIENAAKLIAKITGVTPDYIVKVGFSQTMGILRSMSLPSVPSLQFLRSRKYAIGDNQRSLNQANFLKDGIVSYLDQFYHLPKAVKYLAFRTIDTNLGFEEADSLLEEIVKSGLYKDPSNITLITKPSYPNKRKEVHLADSPLLNDTDWQTDEEFQTFQENIRIYLDNLIGRSEQYLSQNKSQNAYQVISTPFDQKLWLQVEDENERNLYHFDLLRLFVISTPDKDSASSLLLDFITEMETVNRTDLKNQAENILLQIN